MVGCPEMLATVYLPIWMSQYIWLGVDTYCLEILNLIPQGETKGQIPRTQLMKWQMRWPMVTLYLQYLRVFGKRCNKSQTIQIKPKVTWMCLDIYTAQIKLQTKNVGFV